MFFGKVIVPDNKPVAHVQVKVTSNVATEADTDDQGTFGFAMPPLVPGKEALFEVEHRIVVLPCDFKGPGYTNVPQPGQEDFRLVVRSQGDIGMLTSTFLACLVAKKAAHFPISTKKASSVQKLRTFDFHATVLLASHHLPPRGLNSFPQQDQNDLMPDSQYWKEESLALGFQDASVLTKALDKWAEEHLTDLYQIGLAAFYLGEFEKAFTDFAAAINTFPGGPPGRYVVLARTAFELQRYGEAISNLKLFLTLHPEDSLVQRDLQIAEDALRRNPPAPKPPKKEHIPITFDNQRKKDHLYFDGDGLWIMTLNGERFDIRIGNNVTSPDAIAVGAKLVKINDVICNVVFYGEKQSVDEFRQTRINVDEYKGQVAIAVVCERPEWSKAMRMPTAHYGPPLTYIFFPYPQYYDKAVRGKLIATTRGPLTATPNDDDVEVSVTVARPQQCEPEIVGLLSDGRPVGKRCPEFTFDLSLDENK